MKIIPPEEIKAIQLQILDEIDAFCQNEGLRYSLAYGTLIGAVRHKGFIPWDDDIDIIMPRPDYDVFIKTFRSDTSKVMDLSASGVCIEMFAKVSRNGTLMKDHELGRTLWGVNVDIFPIDGAPEEGLESFYDEMVRMYSWVPRLCPFYRVVDSGKLKWFIKYILKRIRFPHIGSCVGVKSSILARLREHQFTSSPIAGAFFGDDEIHEFMPKDWFEEYTSLEFEGKRYSVISHFDDYLKNLFGDYMKLPPEEDRVSLHSYDTFFV